MQSTDREREDFTAREREGTGRADRPRDFSNDQSHRAFDRERVEERDRDISFGRQQLKDLAADRGERQQEIGIIGRALDRTGIRPDAETRGIDREIREVADNLKANVRERLSEMSSHELAAEARLDRTADGRQLTEHRLAAQMGSLQESNRCVRQTGTDANSAQAASRDGFALSGRSSSGAGASVVSHA